MKSKENEEEDREYCRWRVFGTCIHPSNYNEACDGVKASSCGEWKQAKKSP